MSALLTPGQYMQLPAAPADRRFQYGQQEDQFAELFLPSGPPREGGFPVVVLMHGGCWRQQFGAAPLTPMARALNDDGLAVWNLEYRRLDGDGGWPQTFEDAANGSEYLLRASDDHSFRLDTSRVVLAGHSAGGHLALWLAGRRRLGPQAELPAAGRLEPIGVVSLAGIGDMADAVQRNICRGAPAQLLGGAPEEQPARYREGSPAELLPLGTRQWHIVGKQDQLVPPAHVSAFAARAREKGDEVRLVEVENAGHFEIVVPGTEAFDQTRSVLRKACQR